MLREKKNRLTTDTVLQEMRHFMCASGFAAACMMMIPMVFASGQEDGRKVIRITINGICMAVRVIGILLVVVAIIRAIMSYTNQEAPEQQKAFQLAGVAVVLIVMSLLIPSLHLEDWFRTSDFTMTGRAVFLQYMGMI